MYQITCDDYVLYDPRDEELVLIDPRCNLGVSQAGGMSFTILPNHPYYNQLQRLRSVFTLLQNGQVIFRGRMTNDSKDFNNMISVDVEGVLAYTNDTVIPPFDNEDIPQTVDNPVENLFRWILAQHNAQCAEFQQIKPGTVTVTDLNDYITRSSSAYATTWETLKAKLFESALGGHLVMRYESDGNYLDYLSEFTLTNTQEINFGENLLDILRETEGENTYSAILPTGVEAIQPDGTKDVLTVADLPDGEISSGIIKEGVFIYSQAAVNQYGWIVCPLKNSSWTDVTDATNLRRKAAQQLAGVGVLLNSTLTMQAIDLNCTDEQIQSFRVGRLVRAKSVPHGIDELLPLLELNIDILNPQDTDITVGAEKATLTGSNNEWQTNAAQRIENAGQLAAGVQGNLSTLQQQVLTLETSVASTAEAIVLGALRDYTKTGDFNQFRQTIQSQLSVMAEQMQMNFTVSSERIDNVNGDLQRRFTELSKYIRFSVDGIEIGKDENSLKLQLDNDLIRFTKNGLDVGWWDGTDFHTGNIIVSVNERAQFGQFAFIPRSDGSLMFLKVGAD